MIKSQSKQKNNLGTKAKFPKSPEEFHQQYDLIHLVPEMFWLTAQQGCKDGRCKIKQYLVKSGRRFGDEIRELIKSENVKELSIEAGDVSYAEYLKLRRDLNPLGVKISRLKSKIASLRTVKSVEEIGLIEQAVAISEAAFREWLPELRVGTTEAQAQLLLETEMKNQGAQGVAFPSVVAFGDNSAIPHHVPGERALQQGDIVLVDWGAKVEKYNADMTRTFIYECTSTSLHKKNYLRQGQHYLENNKKFQKRFAAVEKAYKGALAAFAQGKDLTAVVEAANHLLGDYSEKMIHALGHGIGIEVHELPFLRGIGGEQEGASEAVQSGTVLALEPGIYFKGWGGIRLERTVVIESGGVRELGDLPLDVGK